MSNILAEALARIEHKLDLLLNTSKNLVIPQVGDFSHTCPVCKVPVSYIVDIVDELLVRKCGCKTGKQAPIKLEAFAPPKGDKGGRNNQEDRTDADSDRGDGWLKSIKSR